MTEVIFTKDAGRFKKNRIVNFPPALADFFVSKVRCAEFKKPPVREVKVVTVENKEVKVEDFSDVLAGDVDGVPNTQKNKNKQKAGRYRGGNAHRYSRRDMRAEV